MIVVYCCVCLWFMKVYVYVCARWVWNFHMRFFFLNSYSSSFPIKMLATDEKTQKIEPGPIFLWQTKVSEAVCKRDWHNVRSYLFFNVLKFRTQCTMAFSSQWGQKKIINAGNLFRTRDSVDSHFSKILLQIIILNAYICHLQYFTFC